MKTWMFRLAIVAFVFLGATVSATYTYTNKDHGITLSLPDEWELGDSGTEDMIVALSKWEGPGDAFRENMNIIVTPLEEAIDLQSLYNLNVANAESMLTAFKAWEVEKTTIAGLPAMKLVYSFDFEGVSLKNIVYLLLQDKNMYTVTFATSVDKFDEHKEQFQEMAESLQIQRKTSPIDSSHLEGLLRQ